MHNIQCIQKTEDGELLIKESQRALMIEHLDMVIEMNKKMNLTRIDDREEGMLLHIEDSLTACEEIDAAPGGRMADIGSGAGYPGIPLAIATGRQTTLVEARKKKADALSAMTEALGLEDQIKVYCGRAELLARTSPSSFSVITARALSKMSVLMELASPLLEQDGLLVCYKACIDKEEYDNARRVQPLTAMHLVSDREVKLGDGSMERRIVCFQKKGKPEARLPRKEGVAQKHPL